MNPEKARAKILASLPPPVMVEASAADAHKIAPFVAGGF
jgi:hypothetical protein